VSSQRGSIKKADLTLGFLSRKHGVRNGRITGNKNLRGRGEGEKRGGQKAHLGSKIVQTRNRGRGFLNSLPG